MSYRYYKSSWLSYGVLEVEYIRASEDGCAEWYDDTDNKWRYCHSSYKVRESFSHYIEGRNRCMEFKLEDISEDDMVKMIAMIELTN